MLKPEEIKNVTFEQSVFSGYKKEDVDAFLDKLYGEYSRLYKENGELVGKLKVCVNKIEEYREDEKFLKSAIVNAQKLNETALQEMETKRKETEENARAQAEEILSQAKAQAEQLVSEANAKVADFREKTTREFAEKQQETNRAFEAEKSAYEQKIADKQAEYAALVNEVEAFRLRAMQVLEQEASLLRELPVAPKTVVTAAPVEAVAEEAFAVVEEEPAPVAEEPTEEETVTKDEPAAVENVIEETAETVAVETVTDEEPEEPKNDDVSDEDQISIDDVLANQSSPVEPSAPIFATDDEDDDTEDGGFQLFGGNPLIFPQDISESDDEDDAQTTEDDKNPRFRKKLKFGVDFDVKKDK